MELVKLDGIILRRIKYGDSSVIATVFTKEQGKISLMAKGVRSGKSKSVSPAALEPLNRVEAICYIKTTRAVQLISSIDILDDYVAIKSDLERIESATSILKGIERYAQEHDPSEPLWKLLLNALEAISEADEISLPLLKTTFRAALLSSAGFKPELYVCSICGGKSEENCVFSTMNGGIVCKDCAGAGIPISTKEIAFLRRIFEPANFGNKLEWDRISIAKIERIIREFGEFHAVGK